MQAPLTYLGKLGSLDWSPGETRRGATVLYLPVRAQVQYCSYYAATPLLDSYFATARYSTVQVPQQRANALYIATGPVPQSRQSRQYWAVY